MAFIFFAVPPAFCQDKNANEEGRYRLYGIKLGINTQEVPFLVDTNTGKVWVYEEDLSAKKKFIGISVEGVAFSHEVKEQEALSKRIAEWHYSGFLDKTLKGIVEYIFCEFSYWPDLEKVEMINSKLKNRSRL